MPENTYTAKLFTLEHDGLLFKLAGTLDGYVNLVIVNEISSKTYTLAPETLLALSEGFVRVLRDIKENCLYDNDDFLEKVKN